MRNRFLALPCVMTIGLGILAAHAGANQAEKQESKPQVKQAIRPEVAALLKQSTAIYARMKSYRHTARWTISRKGPGGDVREDVVFTLALERPNRFVYKMDSKSQSFPPVAAYCDGVTFTNFKFILVPVPSGQYTRVAAPKSYTGINIVDDVEFQPIATYVVALMLQGDALADKDVRAAMERAVIKPTVTENGKKWQVLEMPFGADELPITLYFGQDDHLIGKSVTTPGKSAPNSDTKIIEVLDAIKIDKPIDPDVFKYTLPANATKVERFTGPQRPDDARLQSAPVRVARR